MWPFMGYTPWKSNMDANHMALEKVTRLKVLKVQGLEGFARPNI